MGSQLFDKKAIEKGEFDALASRIKETLAIIQSLKG
jgi:hypothetical protein